MFGFNLFKRVILLIGLFGVSTVMGQLSYDFAIGTYTSRDTEGINVIRYNSFWGSLKVKQVITGVENPSYLVADKDNSILLAGSETGGKQGGLVTLYQLDIGSDKFNERSKSHTVGEHTCVVAWDKQNRIVLAGNYSGGNIAVYHVNEFGELGQNVQLVQHIGESIFKDRQDKPHVHDIVFHPNGKQVFVADLGVDKVYIYDYDPNGEQVLVPSKIPFIKISGGNGPRHLAFDTTGRYMYLVHEISAEISVWKLNENVVVRLQKESLVRNSGMPQKWSGAELKVSPNGKFLYVTNRGDYNEILVYAIEENHKLRLIQDISSRGKTPRSFEITPNGKYLLCTNQDSNSITTYKIRKDGKLKPRKTTLEIPKPVYITNW